MNINLSYNQFTISNYTFKSTESNTVSYVSSPISKNIENDESQFSDSTAYGRFLRFNNPLISYDYKCGNYLGI
jgi:hypothetical protein